MPPRVMVCVGLPKMMARLTESECSRQMAALPNWNSPPETETNTQMQSEIYSTKAMDYK